jgi:uncharacterized protein (TIGR02145 family)
MAYLKTFRREVRGLLFLAVLVFCACTQVPEYCGEGNSPFDFINQRCDGNGKVVVTPPTPPDSAISPPDSTVTPPDSTISPPDSTVSPPDNTVTPPDNTVSPPDSTVTPPPIEKYTVTVLSAGTDYYGGGDYAAGAPVNIIAGTAPEGKYFKEWTTTDGVRLTNAKSASTTFIMPDHAVTVTANFEWSGVDPNTVIEGTITDDRDQQTYKTVKIGDQTWMAENLKYKALGESWCYGEGGQVNIYNGEKDKTLLPSEIEAYCNKYGRLYTWEAAKNACPSGWHLPNRDEWGTLAKAVGATGDYGNGGTAGKALKSTDGWYNNGNGADYFGFSALPGGYRGDYGGFGNADVSGDWWTATEYDSNTAYVRGMYSYGDYVAEHNNGKSDGLSVRCVND